MKNLTKTFRDGIRTSAKTGPVPGEKPTLFIRLILTVVFVLTAFGMQADVVFTSLYSFTGGNDGAYPEAGLVQDSAAIFMAQLSTVI
jgi:hypothetical protein